MMPVQKHATLLQRVSGVAIELAEGCLRGREEKKSPPASFGTWP